MRNDSFDLKRIWDMVPIDLVDKADMNLLGLILHSILERNLEQRAEPAWMHKRSRTLHVKAGQMEVTVLLTPEGIRIERGRRGKANASVSGNMKAFLKVATRQALIRPVLAGAVKIGGNPFLVLRILPLLRV